MKTSDVIVIGGGLAGLMAAAVAASRKQKVTVLTYGSGSLPLASGAILARLKICRIITRTKKSARTILARRRNF